MSRLMGSAPSSIYSPLESLRFLSSLVRLNISIHNIVYLSIYFWNMPVVCSFVYSVDSISSCMDPLLFVLIVRHPV